MHDKGRRSSQGPLFECSSAGGTFSGDKLKESRESGVEEEGVEKLADRSSSVVKVSRTDTWKDFACGSERQYLSYIRSQL